VKYFSLSLILFYQSAFANCIESKNFLEKATSLYNQHQYLLSSFHFSSASLLECNESELKSKAQLGYLYSLFELGEKDEAFRYLLEVDRKLTSSAQKKLDLFKAIQLQTPTDSVTQKRIQDFEAWKNSLPAPKSPGIAAGLSAVIPGAGQAYVGSYQSAIVAFILNALFLSATLELERKEMHATALASGLVFSVVYFGNIFNAAHTATVYNSNLNRAEVDRHKAELFPELTP
jgi:hypothetical protein